MPEPPLDDKALEIMASQAKRVRREVSLLIRQIARARERLQTQEVTRHDGNDQAEPVEERPEAP